MVSKSKPKIDTRELVVEQAEKEVLGAVLTRNELFYLGADGLQPEWFGNPFHRIVYAELRRMIGAGSPADLITVAESLSKAGLLQERNIAQLAELTSGCMCRERTTEAAAQQVREAARRRHYLLAMDNFAGQQHDSAIALEDSIASFKTTLAQFEQSPAEKAECDGMQALEGALLELAALQQRGQEIPGLKTGLPNLDRATGGLRAGEYTILAGLTGEGKSAFALNAALANVQAGEDVVIFSPEMTRQQIMERALSSLTSTPFHDIRQPGRLGSDELERLVIARGTMPFLTHLHIDDRGGLRIGDLLLAAQRMIARYDVSLIVVDYLQLIHSDERDPRLKVNQVSGALRELAKKSYVAVLAVSQLSRPGGPEEVPSIFQLKESGNLEQDAHMVLLLHRPLIDRQHTGEDLAIIGKNRSGPVGAERVRFNQRFVRWEQRT